jgi:hypothetical protein
MPEKYKVIEKEGIFRFLGNDFEKLNIYLTEGGEQIEKATGI